MLEIEELQGNLEQNNEPEKKFTQAELDKIVEDRLARAKKPEDYDDLKEVLAELEEYGYPQSAKEVKEMIREAKKAAKETQEAERELEELQQQAELTGDSPTLLKEIKRLEKKIETLESAETNKKAEIEAERVKAEIQKKSDDAWNAQLAEFEEKHGDVDLQTLEENQKFMKFIKGKHGQSITELYEDFTELIGETESAAIKKAMSKASRSTNNGKSSGGTQSGLTESQKKTLSDWNKSNPKPLQMSEKEFLESMNR